MKKLTNYLSSEFIEAMNALRPKRAQRHIVAYVESYDDISFWRTLFDEYESEKYHFEVMLPARKSLTKGKKQAMMNMLGEAFGKNMIACVDSDYDYLLQGATATSRQLINNHYILHTYSYAIENLQCYAPSLRQVCVQSTLNDQNILDLTAYMKLYSQICFPLFAWNILFYRHHDLKTMSIGRFCEIVRLTSVNISSPDLSLKQLTQRVTHQISLLERNCPQYIDEHKALCIELQELGVLPEETYFYIQGHHIMDSVVMRLLSPICRNLRNKRETEIQRLASHRQQYNNELSSYRHSQCDVAVMLKKNTNYKDASPYKRIKADIEVLLKEIEGKK